MIATPSIPTLADAKLDDAALEEIQVALLAGLSWLNRAFGKCQIIKERVDNRDVIFPSVYSGGNDYLKVFPDEHIGNFSFFVVEDGEEIRFFRKATDVKIEFGLVVWFDFRNIYPDDWQARTVDNVKEEILRVFGTLTLSAATIELTRIFERPANVYREFTDKEIQTQYNKRPFGMVRINGFLKFNQKTPC